jgi:drug/metabolite transporter (DMT)-like permease
MPAAPDLPATPLEPADRPLAAVGWMVLTGVLFVCVTAIVKHLGDRIPAPQTAFLRYLIGLVFLLPVWPALRDAALSRRAWALFTARGAFHAVGVGLWFFAMTQITIAEVTAMNYLHPVYVTLGAALFLGERLAIRRILAVAAALLGALLILRPGVREVGIGHLAMLACAVFFAGSYLLAKRISSEASPGVVVGLLSLMVTVALAPVALALWVPPTWGEMGWLALVAAVATAGHYTMTLAFRAGPLAVTQPVTFLQLVWSATLGAAVFAEPVDPWVVAGGTVILASVTFIAWREARLGAERRAAAQGPAR